MQYMLVSVNKLSLNAGTILRGIVLVVQAFLFQKNEIKPLLNLSKMYSDILNI